MANHFMMGMQALTFNLSELKSSPEGQSILPIDLAKPNTAGSFFDLVRSAAEQPMDSVAEGYRSSNRRNERSEYDDMKSGGKPQELDNQADSVKGPEYNDREAKQSRSMDRTVDREGKRDIQSKESVSDREKKDTVKKAKNEDESANVKEGPGSEKDRADSSDKNVPIRIGTHEADLARLAQSLKKINDAKKISSTEELNGNLKSGGSYSKKSGYIALKADGSAKKIDELIERFGKTRNKTESSGSKKHGESGIREDAVSREHLNNSDIGADEKRVLSLDKEKWQVSGRVDERHGKVAENRLNGESVKPSRGEGNNAGTNGDSSRSGDGSFNFSSRWNGIHSRTSSGTDVREAAAEKHDLFNSLVKKAKMTMGPDGRSSASIRLKPEILGNLTMDIRVIGNRVEAKLLVESDVAMKWIRDEIDGLKHELKGHGIQVDTFSVRVREPESASAFRQDHGQENLAGRNESENTGDKNDRRGQGEAREDMNSILTGIDYNQVVTEAVENYEASVVTGGLKQGVNLSI